MSLTSIDIGLKELLRDPKRRQEFFRSITQDEIAAQIRALRKERNLTQTAFAREAEMKQSAVSRIEQAEYSSWTLTTLFRVADALNARWRIILQPAEEAMQEYEQLEAQTAGDSQIGTASGAASARSLLAISNVRTDPEPQATTEQPANEPMTISAKGVAATIATRTLQ